MATELFNIQDSSGGCHTMTAVIVDGGKLGIAVTGPGALVTPYMNSPEDHEAVILIMRMLDSWGDTMIFHLTEARTRGL